MSIKISIKNSLNQKSVKNHVFFTYKNFKINELNKLPISASNLYSKNLLNFVINLYDKKSNKINLNLEDEIIKKTLVK